VGGALDTTGGGGAVVVTFGDGDPSAAMAAAAREIRGGVGDLEGWEAVRVLAGVAKFGVDFDDTTYPQEAALETKAVSFQKGCYLGQEVVCMLEMRGHVKRRLVPLVVSGGEAPPRHAVVEDGKGAPIGEVTSAIRGPGGEVRAIAMVKHAFIASGTFVVVAGAEARVA